MSRNVDQFQIPKNSSENILKTFYLDGILPLFC